MQGEYWLRKVRHGLILAGWGRGGISCIARGRDEAYITESPM